MQRPGYEWGLSHAGRPWVLTVVKRKCPFTKCWECASHAELEGHLISFSPAGRPGEVGGASAHHLHFTEEETGSERPKSPTTPRSSSS